LTVAAGDQNVSGVSVETSLHAVTADDLAGDQESIVDRLDERPFHNLGKAWDALHFALGQHTGDHPLAFIESGGEDVPELADGVMAYAHYFEADAVLAIAKALAEVTEHEVRRNFALREEVPDPNKLYPTGFAVFDADTVVRELARVRPFIAEVVAQRLGLLVYTSG
jgi:hypothetical protein